MIRRCAAQLLQGALAAAILAINATAAAQPIDGRVSGIVRDSSGAVVPGATVTMTNESTGISWIAVSDAAGFYIATHVPIGPYSLKTERAGFRTVVKTGYSLVADGRLTVDFVLEPGEVSETVQVDSRSPQTVNTTSGELSRVVDREQAQTLALNLRNYAQLTTLMPGVPLLAFDAIQQTLNDSLNLAVNGGRDDTNNVMVDGGFNLAKANNNLQWHNVGVEFVEEVQIKTANFSAEYGRQSGAAINVATRSGGNRFSGSAFGFLRHDALDAREVFAARKNRLRFHDSGWSLGGPIRKSKAFFFGGQEWRYIRRDSNPVRRTLPTRAERRGDFSGSPGNLFEPGTTTPIPNRDLSALITPDGRAIARVYDAMEAQAASYVDTPTANNATYQTPSKYDARQEILRLDYRFSERHSAYARYLHDSTHVANPFGTFINSPLPTTPTLQDRGPYSILAAYTWVIGERMIYETKGSLTWSRQRVVPQGDVWQRSTYGFSYPQLFDGGQYPDGLPTANIMQTAGFVGPSGANASQSADRSITARLTLTRGRHTLTAGALAILTKNDQGGRVTDNYLGTVSFNLNGNPTTTGHAFADALLGNFRTYTESSQTGIIPFRSHNYEVFLSDNWRVDARLSIEVGMRYQFIQPLYALDGRLSAFDPARYDPAQAVTVNRNGTVVPGAGNPFNGLVRSAGGPEEIDPTIAAVPIGAPRGLASAAHRLAPRLSLAYAPGKDTRTAVRGGFGIFYDSPRGDFTQRAGANPPFVRVAQFENGNLAQLAVGGSVAAPFGELLSVDVNQKTPRIANFSVGVQRELPQGIIAEAAYVGALGRNLIRQPDVNQPAFEILAANAALPAAQRASVNALRPFKGYSAIRQSTSDAVSNYHALQIYVIKRRGDFSMTGSYTWSKALTDASTTQTNPEDPTNRKFNYGPATFDRRHVLVATYTYRIPWFRGAKSLLGAVFADWEVSGITRLQSGALLTITGDTSIGNRRADYVGGEVGLPAGERSADRFFNTAAFEPAPNDRRGTAWVGMVEGPRFHSWDLSLRKGFRFRAVARMQLQADFFNIFNQVNFLAVSTNATSADFGSVTTAAPSRNVQLGLRVTF